MQVMSAFTHFVVKLPEALRKFFFFLSRFTEIFSLDFVMGIDFLACAKEKNFDTDTMLVARTVLPLGAVVFLAIPPVFFWLPKWARACWSCMSSQCAHQQTDVEEGREEEEADSVVEECRRRTQDTAWSNVLWWLFLVTPSSTRASMQV